MREVKASDKGQLGGECNRSACTTRPADWFNGHTGWYYCESCARKINVALQASRLALCRRSTKGERNG
jgi:hypothetical protein